MTPATIHFGKAATVYQSRAKILETAFLANPNQFKGKCHRATELPVRPWVGLTTL